jgi:hypothetical protein
MSEVHFNINTAPSTGLTCGHKVLIGVFLIGIITSIGFSVAAYTSWGLRTALYYAYLKGALSSIAVSVATLALFIIDMLYRERCRNRL